MITLILLLMAHRLAKCIQRKLNVADYHCKNKVNIYNFTECKYTVKHFAIYLNHICKGKYSHL